MQAAPPLLSERDTIVKLLYNIGGRDEVQQYLELFAAVPQFAVIKVGGAVLTDELDVLISSLTFLQKVTRMCTGKENAQLFRRS